MPKKPLIYLIFLLFLFTFCSGCSKKFKNCDFFPNFERIDLKDSENRRNIKNFIKNNGTYAQISCQF